MNKNYLKRNFISCINPFADPVLDFTGAKEFNDLHAADIARQ
jgi:hypothetical protein